PVPSLEEVLLGVHRGHGERLVLGVRREGDVVQAGEPEERLASVVLCRIENHGLQRAPAMCSRVPRTEYVSELVELLRPVADQPREVGPLAVAGVTLLEPREEAQIARKKLGAAGSAVPQPEALGEDEIRGRLRRAEARLLRPRAIEGALELLPDARILG